MKSTPKLRAYEIAAAGKLIMLGNVTLLILAAVLFISPKIPLPAV